MLCEQAHLPASAMARVARVVRCGGFWMVVFDAKKKSVESWQLDV
jgi:hypothetical protein